MLPLLFTVVIPAGWAKPLVLGALAAITLLRALGAVHRARRAAGAARPERGARATGAEPKGAPANGGATRLPLARALREDVWTTAALVAVAAALWRSGLLDRTIRLPLHTYGLLIAAGFLVGIWLAQREAARRGQDPDRIADLAFWILVAALVGSRVYFIAVNWSDYFGPRAVVETPLGRIPRLFEVWEGGLVFYGGFIAAALTTWWYLRRHRMAFLAHADTLIPSVAIGHFLGRLGCFCAGCCWGDVGHAHLPWLVRFPPESLAFQTFAERADPGLFLAADRLTTLPLHPTQLYESFGELGLFLVLVLFVRPRKRFHGQVLAAWLLMYAVLRTLVETFRGDVERGVVMGLGVGQWTSLLIFAAGAVLWARAPRPVVAEAPAARAA